MSEWKPITTAPKGEPKPYGSGPQILGVALGGDWTAYQLVSWQWHKNATTGAWKGPLSNWQPSHWMPLPEPPSAASEG